MRVRQVISTVGLPIRNRKLFTSHHFVVDGERTEWVRPRQPLPGAPLMMIGTLDGGFFSSHTINPVLVPPRAGYARVVSGGGPTVAGMP